MWLSRFRISDKEPCPCGSGKKYKECCKIKKTQVIPSKKPPEVQIMEKMRHSLKKCCLHPDHENCKGRIKEAHALQNNKIISLLAGSERHVYMIDTKKKPLLVPLDTGEVVPIVQVSRVGVNNATTETCFCDLHDSTVFSIIEKGAPDFDNSRRDMEFVYAYKAFIFEYYKQKMAFEIFQQNFSEHHEAFLSPDMVGMYRMLQLKTNEFEPIKKHFDTQILANTFDGICTCAIKIPFQIKFACYAYIAPDYDLNGKKIRHTIKGSMHRVAITIFPEEKQSWILVSCLDSEYKIYINFFNQLKAASIDKLKFYINMVLPLYSENMVLSPTLWNSWSEEVQMAYTFYANLHGPKAHTIGMGIGMGLRNAAKDKSGNAYLSSPKINLFL